MTRSTDSSPRFIKFNPRFIILRDRWMSWDRRPREHTIQLELFPHRNNQLRLGSSIVRGTVQWITIRYAVRERRLTRPSLPRMLDPVLYFSEGKKNRNGFRSDRTQTHPVRLIRKQSLGETRHATRVHRRLFRRHAFENSQVRRRRVVCAPSPKRSQGGRQLQRVHRERRRKKKAFLRLCASKAEADYRLDHVDLT
jgi:hypothetical protein